MICLYADENVNGNIVRGLRRRNIQVITAVEDKHDHTDDGIVLDRAGELRCLLFTQDDDLLKIARYRQANGIPFLGVLYAPQGTPIGPCVRDLELIAIVETLEEYDSRVQYIPI